jgi:hypothetical protein
MKDAHRIITERIRQRPSEQRIGCLEQMQPGDIVPHMQDFMDTSCVDSVSHTECVRLATETLNVWRAKNSMSPINH